MQTWWTPETVAVVTGANKGIGYDIARKLAQEGVTVVLTARNEDLGQSACQKLRDEGLMNVVFHQLDITDSDTISILASWLSSSYGGLDILVNNAGIAYKGNIFGEQEARTTIGTNYRGTRDVSEHMLPIFRESAESHGARIVNVSSSEGELRIVSPELQARFSSPDLTIDQLDALVEEFISSIEDGSYRTKGWPGSMYGVSKLAESAYTRILAREVEEKRTSGGPRVFVNACCPGYCATDMSSWGGRPSELGADTPVFLALHPPINGGYFSEMQQIDW